MATPRTHVSMAGFYDWSTEEFDDVSMPSVYQKLAMHHKSKYNKGSKAWCMDGVHLNPGRMFVRDKADLTKGEREIIAGIYKNRGDMYNGARNGFITHVRSHKDAWLVGKHLQKKGINTSDCEKCSIKLPDNLFSKPGLTREHSDCGSYMCDKCKDCVVTSQTLKSNRSEKPVSDVTGRKAPPSTPDNSPKTNRKPLLKPRTHEGAVFVESGKTFYDVNEGSKKKKVYVDVFLPKFPTPALVEEPTNLDELEIKQTTLKMTESARLFKIAEQSKEQWDEGSSSHVKSSKTRSTNNKDFGD